MFDKAGTQVVNYVYDSWGKLESTTGTLASTVGVKNPYRYKGYRYDTETGLYYLQSRYYNPEWGRFINADGIVGTPGELLSCNMFAYCGNNPINCYDPSGIWFLDAVLAWGASVMINAVVYTVAAVVSGYATHLVVAAVCNYIADNSSDAPANRREPTSSDEESSTDSEDTTRVRHYTNRKGLEGIENDGEIVASDNNKVYVEPANKRPLSQKDAESKYRIRPGRGRDYVESDVPNSALELTPNPRYGTKELTVRGRIPLKNPRFYRRR